MPLAGGGGLHPVIRFICSKCNRRRYIIRHNYWLKREGFPLSKLPIIWWCWSYRLCSDKASSSSAQTCYLTCVNVPTFINVSSFYLLKSTNRQNFACIARKLQLAVHSSFDFPFLLWSIERVLVLHSFTSGDHTEVTKREDAHQAYGAAPLSKPCFVPVGNFTKLSIIFRVLLSHDNDQDDSWRRQSSWATLTNNLFGRSVFLAIHRATAVQVLPLDLR